jgi:hypothetical protein
MQANPLPYRLIERRKGMAAEGCHPFLPFIFH